jgi:hypothetical protein
MGGSVIIRVVLAILFYQFLLSPTHAAKIDVQKEDEFSVIIVEGDFVLGDEKRFADAAISTSEALVVLGSNGGNLFAGIEIGKAIRLKGFTTLVPDNARCASACALAWLGGRARAMGTTAEVGFHAASNADDGQVTSSGNALVGAYLSQIGLPSAAVVYITEPPPNSIRWLTATDAAKYGIDVKILSLPANSQTARRSSTPQSVPSQNANNSKLAQRAVVTAQSIYTGLQVDNNSVMSFLSELYADEALYFGRTLDKGSILAEKARFFKRWPNRSYKLDNDNIYVSCLDKSCTVNGQVSWLVHSPQRNATANGTASFSYTIDFTRGSPVIVAETSTVTRRDNTNSAQPQTSRVAGANLPGLSRQFIEYIFNKSSADNVTAKALYNEVYAHQLYYYGKNRDKSSVLNDKFNFLNRWPVRQYINDPSKLEIKCNTSRCQISGTVNWAVRSDRRSTISQGVSAFVYVVDYSSGTPKIIAENSANIDRNVQKTARPRRSAPVEDDIFPNIEF